MTRLQGCVAVLLIPMMILGATPIAGAAQELLFDVQPVTLDGRTLVPLRPIFEWIGARVTYEEGHIRAYRSEEATTPQVELWIGSTEAKIAEAGYDLDVAPQLIHGRCFVPLRFVAESFGVWVEAEGRQMRLSLPQEERVAMMAIPPHPQAHLGKMWRVIERWYGMVLADAQVDEGRLPHWNLYSQEKQRELFAEVGEDAPTIVEAHWGGRAIDGIRILDSRVGPGAESGWAEVMVGYADGETEVQHFDFVREPTGWKVRRFNAVEVDGGEATGEETIAEEENDG